jgi:hypothetical protein
MNTFGPPPNEEIKTHAYKCMEIQHIRGAPRDAEWNICLELKQGLLSYHEDSFDKILKWIDEKVKDEDFVIKTKYRDKLNPLVCLIRLMMVARETELNYPYKYIYIYIDGENSSTPDLDALDYHTWAKDKD